MRTLTLLTILSASLLAGCATKGARRITAVPLPGPTISPTNWMKDEAPRREPGKLMDPDSVTFAQIPSRIIYMPGKEGIFSRESAHQEIAYNLVPVDRVPEIQAQGTPTIESPGDKAATDKKAPVTIFPASFVNKAGNSAKGTARRLGVLGKSDPEKVRAQSLLMRGENLQWTPNVGWVGFTEEIVVRPVVTPKKTVEIPEIPDDGKAKAPEMKVPVSSDQKETVKPAPSKKTTVMLEVPDAPEKKKGDTMPENPDKKEGTPVQEGKPPTKPEVKLNKTIGLEVSFDEQ